MIKIKFILCGSNSLFLERKFRILRQKCYLKIKFLKKNILNQILQILDQIPFFLLSVDLDPNNFLIRILLDEIPFRSKGL